MNSHIFFTSKSSLSLIFITINLQIYRIKTSHTSLLMEAKVAREKNSRNKTQFTVDFYVLFILWFICIVCTLKQA